MKTLDEIAASHGADKCSAWGHGYTRYYEPLFDPMRHNPVSIIEIGVHLGNSMRMWCEYFDNPKSSFTGIDIEDKFQSSDSRLRVVRLDQTQKNEWDEFVKDGALYEIVVDDGAHTVFSQTVAFNSLWPSVSDGGIYIIEDTHTWHDLVYWDSPVDFKTFIGILVGAVNRNGKCYLGKPVQDPTVTYLEATIESVTFYRGLCIIKKK